MEVLSIRRFRKNYPKGQNLIIADAEAWRVTKRQNSIAAYETYLNHFPEGRYIKEALQYYQSLQGLVPG